MDNEPHSLAFPKLPVRLFNTETRTKEEFQPLSDNHVRMYTCGPTVYHFAHIGNFRTYVFEDLLRRSLKFFGFKVTQVVNITDIDDKTIRGSIESNKTLSEFTEPYTKAFFEDLQTLGIEPVEHYPRATEFIPLMIEIIQNLMDKGIAYRSKDNSIYYAIEKCPRYGRLSHLKLAELKPGEGDLRILCDEYDKENVADFVLWKAYEPKRDGSIFWESPFGPGRPGWHLECSAMAINLLGESLDIHCGAVDNIFPHHENEIAQSEAFSGKTFARYWLHSEHLIVENKKMSKSLGNFYTLRDLLEKGFTGPEVRYMLLHIHYRTQLNFTFEGLQGARNSLARINHFAQRMFELADSKVQTSGECHPFVQKAIAQFSEAIADDLNISVALAALFDLMHAVNVLLEKGKVNGGDAHEVLSLLQQWNHVLGIINFEHEENIPESLQELLRQREEARTKKEWALSDKLRQEILASGYVIEDTPRGPRLKKGL